MDPGYTDIKFCSLDFGATKPEFDWDLQNSVCTQIQPPYPRASLTELRSDMEYELLLRISNKPGRADLISRLPMLENRLKESGCQFTAFIDPDSIQLNFQPFPGVRTISGLSRLEQEIIHEYLANAGFIVARQWSGKEQIFSLEIAVPIRG